MIREREVLYHPITGERLRFLLRSEDTDGELMRMEFWFAPYGFVAGAHIHPHQEERWEILSGKAQIRIDRERIEADPGEVIVVPPNTPHVMRNPEDRDLHMIVDFRPALNTEKFFETYFGLATDGKVGKKTGLPNPLQLAVFVHEFWEMARPPLPSALLPIAHGVLSVFARIGKRFGYRAIYPEYSAAK